jgi:hypothetical protein
MEIKTATVTGVEGSKIKVKFSEDTTPSRLGYSMLSSVQAAVGDTVLMLRTSTSYICIGAVKK